MKTGLCQVIGCKNRAVERIKVYDRLMHYWVAVYVCKKHGVME